MSRMPPLDAEMLSPEQKRIYEQIAGKRKTVRGPFPMWLRNPKLAEHANQFGIALRDHSTIGRRIFELAVITVCRAGSVQYAWSSHAPQPELPGIAPGIGEAIRQDRGRDVQRRGGRGPDGGAPGKGRGAVRVGKRYSSLFDVLPARSAQARIEPLSGADRRRSIGAAI